MSNLKLFHTSFSLLLIISLFSITTITHGWHRTKPYFTMKNNCPYTVWGAALPRGGQQMNSGDTWTIDVNPLVSRIWARTGCTSSGPNSLKCTTGDCGGVLHCTTNGIPPYTQARYIQSAGIPLDFFYISLVNGFNVPMSIVPIGNDCTSSTSCTGDVIGQCPSQLRTYGGCNNPCTVFKTDEYCCYSGTCSPTDFSRYFKNLCPTAFTYLKDAANTTFACRTGTSYTITFCP